MCAIAHHTRWSMSPGTMRSPIASGPVCACRLKPSGRGRRAAVTKGCALPGVTTCMTRRVCHAAMFSGAGFRMHLLRDGCLSRLMLERVIRMGLACTTSAAMSGSGVQKRWQAGNAHCAAGRFFVTTPTATAIAYRLAARIPPIQRAAISGFESSAIDCQTPPCGCVGSIQSTVWGFSTGSMSMLTATA